MANLIDLRRRIRSVRNTQQVTKAMKTVATAKYKKASRKVAEGRPLWHSGPASVSRLADWAGPSVHPLLDVRAERAIDVLVLTSDKGLCGAFNANLLANTHEFLKSRERGTRIQLTLIGKKAVQFFRHFEYPVAGTFVEKTDRMTAAELKNLAAGLMEKFLFRETDAVYAAYNEFKSVLAPKITITRLLPVAPPAPGKEEAEGTVPATPEWAPSPGPLVSSLWPRYLEAQIAHAYSESLAAEQAARMMAMDNASNNAEDLIEGLTLNMNKARQAGITKELLEIITAVEALKS
jgi:F-type H+-transporting ATPase subunit gamma